LTCKKYLSKNKIQEIKKEDMIKKKTPYRVNGAINHEGIKQ
jgi:hypothetical protein